MSQTTMSRQQALDQRRAKHAWEVVQQVRKLYGDRPDAAHFGRAAKKLPTRIVASGLGQALAFLLAKKRTPLLLVALSDWVLTRRPNEKAPGALPSAESVRDQKALIQKLIESDMVVLRLATDEVLAYLQWLNRFVEAEIKDDQIGEDH